jgi:hypothetical protein
MSCCVQRERVLAAQFMDRPSLNPMGRDGRAELDGYAEQSTSDVVRQLCDAGLLFSNVLSVSIPRTGTSTSCTTIRIDRRGHSDGWPSIRCMTCITTCSMFGINWTEGYHLSPGRRRLSLCEYCQIVSPFDEPVRSFGALIVLTEECA